MPLMSTFSRPLISGWKPAPELDEGGDAPVARVRLPRVGLVIPARSFRSVDLPEPFSPMTPKVEPVGHLEGDAFEGGEGLVGLEVGEQAAGEERALQGLELVLVEEPAVDLGDVAGDDGRGPAHTSSARVSRRRSNRKAPSAKVARAARAAMPETLPVVEVAVEEDLLVRHQDVGHGVEAEERADARPSRSP